MPTVQISNSNSTIYYYKILLLIGGQNINNVKSLFALFCILYNLSTVPDNSLICEATFS